MYSFSGFVSILLIFSVMRWDTTMQFFLWIRYRVRVKVSISHSPITGENHPVPMRNRCHSSLAFLLKVLNFLQTFIGISIIFYSLWMLNQWNHQIPVPSPPAPSPDSSQFPFLMSDTARVPDDKINPFAFAADMVSGSDDNGLLLQFIKLPAPWYFKFFEFCPVNWNLFLFFW